MIELHNVYKRFGEIAVLKDLNFKIGEGEVVGLLGPNGAGKTTTLRTITGLLPASRGMVSINGKNPLEDDQVKHNLGFLPENNPLYEEMTVEEWLKFWSQIKYSRVNKEEILEAVEKSGLQEVYYRPIMELSKGYRQRVGLAQAILGKPKILILDEPTEGLDPNQRHEIHNLIKDLGKKRTVVISSHVLSEISKMCSRVLIMHKGAIVADGSPESLGKTTDGEQIIEAVIEGSGVMASLRKLPGVKSVDEINEIGPGNRYVIKSKKDIDLRLDVFKASVDKKWQLYELVRKQIALEDVFAQLTIDK